MTAPRSFASLEDDTFGVGRKTAAGASPRPTITYKTKEPTEHTPVGSLFYPSPAVISSMTNFGKNKAVRHDLTAMYIGDINIALPTRFSRQS
ncbi:MAG: hypothetical protein IKC72_05480 [Clostridia bacterium]|nr:hypothetical protein [Clostridia bacterium]